jgi:hypothetical protein
MRKWTSTPGSAHSKFGTESPTSEGSRETRSLSILRRCTGTDESANTLRAGFEPCNFTAGAISCVLRTPGGGSAVLSPLTTVTGPSVADCRSRVSRGIRGLTQPAHASSWYGISKQSTRSVHIQPPCYEGVWAAWRWLASFPTSPNSYRPTDRCTVSALASDLEGSLIESFRNDIRGFAQCFHEITR